MIETMEPNKQPIQIYHNKHCIKLYFHIKIHTLLQLIKLAVKIEIGANREKTILRITLGARGFHHRVRRRRNIS